MPPDMMPTLSLLIQSVIPEKSYTTVGEDPFIVCDIEPDIFSLFPDDLRIRLLSRKEADLFYISEFYSLVIERNVKTPGGIYYIDGEGIAALGFLRDNLDFHLRHLVQFLFEFVIAAPDLITSLSIFSPDDGHFFIIYAHPGDFEIPFRNRIISPV